MPITNFMCVDTKGLVAFKRKFITQKAQSIQIEELDAQDVVG